MSGSVSKKITSKSRWRKYQKNNHTKKTLSLGILALGVLVILILVSKLFGVLISFNQPFSPDSQVKYTRHNWDGAGILNLVVKTKDLNLLSFDPATNTVTLLNIPDETYLELPQGYGKWPARSIYDLGQSESKGSFLLKGTISRVFGVPVDGYLIYPGQEKLTGESLVNKFKQDPLSLNLIFSAKTDLSAGELLRFWWEMKSVRSDKINTLNLAQSNLTSWILLADGSRVLDIDKLRLDQFIQGHFEDNRLSQEGLSIGIYNATDHSGLAEKASRMIANMGGRVVFATTASTAVPKSTVIGKKSYSYNKLSEVFNASQNTKVLGADFDTNRADVVVVLGEDFYAQSN